MTQVLKFLAVGVLNTAIQYVLFIALYRVIGVNYLFASVIGYCAGMINSYLLNRNWTFASRNRRVLREAARFTVVNLAALCTNTALLYFFVTSLNFRPPIAQIWAIAGSLTINFLLNKFWTFNVAASRPLCL